MPKTSFASNHTLKAILELEKAYAQAIWDPYKTPDVAIHPPSAEQLEGFHKALTHLESKQKILGSSFILSLGLAACIYHLGMAVFGISFTTMLLLASSLAVAGGVYLGLISDRATQKWHSLKEWLIPLASHHSCVRTLELATSCDTALAYRQEVLEQGREFCVLDSKLLKVIADRDARRVQREEFQRLHAEEKVKEKQACSALHGLAPLET